MNEFNPDSLPSTDQELPSQPASAEPYVMLGDKQIPLTEAYSTIANSGNWFFWIGGLSIINTLISMTNGEWGLIIGLGITQVSDLIIGAIVSEASETTVLVGRLFQVGFTLVVAAVLGILGFNARKGRAWAFIVGMILYGCDAGIYLLGSDWLALGFHAFVLFALWGGLSMTNKVDAVLRAPQPYYPPSAG